MDSTTVQTLLGFLIDWIKTYPTWAGVGIAAIAMAESLVLVGMIVPGAIMMLAVGALIALGALELWSSLGWAIAGAIIGDGLSFWLGHHYRDDLHRIWPFHRLKRTMKRGEDFFRRHGGKSVIFGRFVGPVRAVVPTIAGMMGMSPRRFFLVNVLSAFAWAPAYILPGVVFGASLELAAEVAVRLAIVLLLLLSALLLTVWGVRRLFSLLQPRAERMTSWLMDWGRSHPVLGHLSGALVDPRHPESRALLVFAGLLLVAGFAFFGVLWSAMDGPGSVDATVASWMQDLRTPIADVLMVRITMLGDAVVFWALAIVLLAYLLWRRNIPAAAHWIAAAGFGAVLVRVLKLSIGAARPGDFYAGASAYAFPSAHATMSMVVYGFLAVLVSRELPPRLRALPYAAAGLLIIAIAVSRVYLNAHWLSDVVGGLLLGLAWVALLGIAYRRHASPPLPLGSLVATLLLTFAVVSGLHLSHNYPEERERYAVRYPVQTLSMEEWWSDRWKELPAFRNDLRGRQDHPFNLQWAGSLAELRQHLGDRGWRRPPSVELHKTLQWLSPDPNIGQMPVLPQVHDGRHQELLMTYPADGSDRQWVLRLWPADARLEPPFGMIWIGTVSEQRLSERLDTFAYPVTGTDFDTPLDVLRRQLEGFEQREVRRATAGLSPEAQWSGTVLLLRPASQLHDLESLQESVEPIEPLQRIVEFQQVLLARVAKR